MKPIIYLLALIVSVSLTACGGDKPAESGANPDSLEMMNGSTEETQRFLDQEGDIIHDENVDTLPANEDATDDEDPETNLPPVEE